MTAKLHINLNQGLVEVEGSEEFVLKVYNDFKDKIARSPYSPQNTGQQNQPPTNSASQSTSKKSTASKKDSAGKSSGGVKKKSASKGYSLCSDLNLYTEDNKPSLKDFIESYNAGSNMPRYLLFTHYLKVIKGVEKVGPNQIYTCFKHLGLKIPSIKQGLHDTSHHKGWLNTSDIEDVQIEVAGENAIDHELAKKQEAAA